MFPACHQQPGGQIMKTKKTSPSRKAKPAAKLKDIKPVRDVKGGYNPKELGITQSVPWKH
jgi:hypothetical protein